MNGASLGAKYFVSALNGLQTVVPTPPGFCGPCYLNAAPPPASTSLPRCVLYQAPSALGSFDLKKVPPMPVTRRAGVVIVCRYISTTPRLAARPGREAILAPHPDQES